MSTDKKRPATVAAARAPKQTVNSTNTIAEPQDVSSGEPLLKEALGYAARDWPVLPLHSVDKTGACSCSKPDCSSPGKHPHTPHGIKDATTEVKAIQEWWTNWPDANIGIAAGKASRLVVLDIDPRNGGEKTLEALEEQHGKLPQTVEQQTGGGGRHLLFRHPGGHIKSRNIAPGLDVKADGGYIVVAPSGHVSGDYVWKSPPGPDSTRLAEMPRWLLDLLGKPSSAGQVTQIVADGPRIPKGQRNTTLTSLAGSMRRLGASQKGILAALNAENSARCDPALSDQEVAKIAQSVAKYRPGQCDSIPAPIERGFARNELPEPVPASKLGQGEQVCWIWHGYLAPKIVSLLSARPKVGKTTLLAHLIKMLGEGGELVGRFEPRRVLIVTEEAAGLWRGRCDKLGIGDHAEFIVRPFKGRSTQRQWQDLVNRITELVRERNYAVVAFDTFAALCPIRDENDAAQMLQTLTPLLSIAEAGAAVLLIHHQRKGDAAQGQAVRGSSALTGFVDIIMELGPYDAARRADNRRILETRSRFDETPGEVIIELTDDGYRFCGDKAGVKQEGRRNIIKLILPDGEPGRTADEVLEAWPVGKLKPGRRTLDEDLRTGAEEGRWVRSGKGVKGDPVRYFKPKDSIPASSIPIGAGTESTEISKELKEIAADLEEDWQRTGETVDSS